MKLPAIVRNGVCSFSGVETRAQALIDDGIKHAEIAYAAYDCMARTFGKMVLYAMEKAGVRRALLAGGVASSPLLRALLRERVRKQKAEAEIFFGESALSSDNAVGTALLCKDRLTASPEGGTTRCKADML